MRRFLIVAIESDALLTAIAKAPGLGRTRRYQARPHCLLRRDCRAGIVGAPGQKTGNVNYESWAHEFNVNTMGPLRVVESFSDHIARSERRTVITVTSGMGSLTDNTSGGPIAYRSSKAAVNMVMRSAAIDLAPRGIICVLVNPGSVRTDMGGPKAPLSPQESVPAMRRLIETFGPNQSGKSMVIGDARAKLSESELFFLLRCINAMPAVVIDAFPVISPL
ncbi:MAG: SDR family NAD(P)-dependent oxidoreductase [Methylocella sp.]